MAQQEEIVLWIDQRWKNAIEMHLKDETLQEHLENVLDELCNQLPEREYERISRAIQSEAAAQRAKEEAARTYLAQQEICPLIQDHCCDEGQQQYRYLAKGTGSQNQHGDHDDRNIDHDDTDLGINGFRQRVAQVCGYVEIIV